MLKVKDKQKQYRAYYTKKEKKRNSIKNENSFVPVVGMERTSSRSQGQCLNHYTMTDSENLCTQGYVMTFHGICPYPMGPNTLSQGTRVLHDLLNLIHLTQLNSKVL